MAAVCEATNQSGLPAFVIVDVLEKVLKEMRPAMENEFQHDLATWNEELQKGREAHAEALEITDPATPPTDNNEKE